MTVREPVAAVDATAVAHVIVEDLGAELALVGDAGHHLQRVRRLRVGERVTASDGAGLWRVYSVVGAGSGRLEARAAGEPRRAPAPPWPLSIAFAITKGDGPEAVVTGATELGIDRCVPLLTERSVARPDPERLARRLRRAARTAAEQSRRATLPAIDPIAGLEALAGESLVVADRNGGGLAPNPGPGGWTLLVGPEGGFSDAEEELLEGRPRLGIGPNVLRATTAAIAACAIGAAIRGGA